MTGNIKTEYLNNGVHIAYCEDDLGTIGYGHDPHEARQDLVTEQMKRLLESAGAHDQGLEHTSETVIEGYRGCYVPQL